MDINIEVKVEPEEKTQKYGVVDRNPPERCPRPLYSQDCPEENFPENSQAEDLMDIKVEIKDEPEEETDFGADQQYGVIDRNPLERCPRPLYSQDCPEASVPEHYQGEDLMDIKVEVKDESEEETDFGDDQQYGVIDRNPPERCPRLTNCKMEDEEERRRGHHPCMRGVKEEMPGGVVPENPSKNSEGNFMLSLNDKGDYGDIVQHSPAEDFLTLNFNPDESYNPPDHEEPSPDQPHIVTTRTEQNSVKMFQCEECGKLFTKRSDLCTHKRTHSVKKLLPCPECGKCFAKQSHLVIHERSHTGEKPYSCSECGKCFSKKSSLVRHEKIHSDKRPYPCSHCGKCYISKSYLFRHEMSHMGVKPYTCSECGKWFMQKSNFNRHKCAHTAEKPFSCSECGKCFTDKSNLDRHEKSHSREDILICV